MGLDMYLNAKRYFWHNETEITEQIAKLLPEIGEKRVKEITVQAMYWRKSNQIHQWFVDNVQKGVDDCGYYEVSSEQLQQLIQVIEEVLANRDSADKILPTASGFFFGGTEYNEWYFKDLEDTLPELKELLDPKWKGWDFEYHSSW